MMKRLLILAAAVAAVLPGAAAAQYRDYETVSVAVDVADLDMSTRAGVRELERRVGRAVDRICRGDRDCRDGAWDSTWDQAMAAIARDREMRRLAAERAAQLRACGYRGCPPPQPAYWGAPAPPPAPAPPVSVIVINIGYPPPAPYPYRR